jgi:hypothetical protein
MGLTNAFSRRSETVIQYKDTGLWYAAGTEIDPKMADLIAENIVRPTLAITNDQLTPKDRSVLYKAFGKKLGCAPGEYMLSDADDVYVYGVALSPFHDRKGALKGQVLDISYLGNEGGLAIHIPSGDSLSLIPETPLSWSPALSIAHELEHQKHLVSEQVMEEPSRLWAARFGSEKSIPEGMSRHDILQIVKLHDETEAAQAELEKGGEFARRLGMSVDPQRQAILARQAYAVTSSPKDFTHDTMGFIANPQLNYKDPAVLIEHSKNLKTFLYMSHIASCAHPEYGFLPSDLHKIREEGEVSDAYAEFYGYTREDMQVAVGKAQDFAFPEYGVVHSFPKDALAHFLKRIANDPQDNLTREVFQTRPLPRGEKTDDVISRASCRYVGAKMILEHPDMEGPSPAVRELCRSYVEGFEALYPGAAAYLLLSDYKEQVNSTRTAAAIARSFDDRPSMASIEEAKNKNVLNLLWTHVRNKRELARMITEDQSRQVKEPAPDHSGLALESV